MGNSILNQNVVVIDYNAGNIQSVLYALDRLGVNAKLSSDHHIIKNADKVIFPGVGEASTTMAFLNSNGLSDTIRGLQQPVFAICIGQQLICAHSQEGDVDCIGIMPVQVKRFKSETGVKVPHMGWNKIQNLNSPLFHGIDNGSYVYFVHSYYCEQNEFATSGCTYGLEFAASMQKDNFYSCQFHPEKSGPIGEKIIKNFLELKS